MCIIYEGGKEGNDVCKEVLMTQRTFVFQEGTLLPLKMDDVPDFKGSRQSIPEEVVFLY